MKDTSMRRSLNRLLLSAAFALPMLASTAAFAGDIKFGQEMLDVDDKGNLTADAKKKTVTELDNVPGEDMWLAFTWVKVDNGAEGPLYVEFFQDINGEQHLVWRYEESNYDGSKYVSMEIELEGRLGFNKDRTYAVRVLQVNAKGKDIVMAKSKISLIKSGKEPPPDEDDDDDKGDDKGADEQDDIDTFGDDEEPPPETPSEAPPPVEPKKKGCSIDGDGFGGFNGALVLFGIAGGLLYRRRR
ncbi:MAG: hypothetical protein KC486_04980 [Myxococcales bacterium]|nr:hypothetical protein [Myxococcales bacterium]